MRCFGCHLGMDWGGETLLGNGSANRHEPVPGGHRMRFGRSKHAMLHQLYGTHEL
jgi:hypothetical protein